MSAFWSLTCISSLEECIARIGMPASTVGIFRKAEEILPSVDPPLESERLENFL